jgi:aromatic ring-opening dioxygenase LigB subunit
MAVMFACISPHGVEVIPELSDNMYDAFAETRKSMLEMASQMKRLNLDSIVLATPHNLRLEAKIGVVTAEFTEGSLKANGRLVELRCSCDRELAKSILEEARKSKLPVVGVNYGTSEGPASCMPMDWGTLIPLWFLVGRGNDDLKVVIVTPSREIPLEELVSFGEVISEVTAASEKRVAFVASADQGHAHRADGPYGYNPASAEFDQLVKEAVQRNDLRSLLNLSSEFVENAKPDSLWQLAILHGILKHTRMAGHFLSYQVPTYYGILCAYYLPAEE